MAPQIPVSVNETPPKRQRRKPAKPQVYQIDEESELEKLAIAESLKEAERQKQKAEKQKSQEEQSAKKADLSAKELFAKREKKKEKPKKAATQPQENPTIEIQEEPHPKEGSFEQKDTPKCIVNAKYMKGKIVCTVEWMP